MTIAVPNVIPWPIYQLVTHQGLVLLFDSNTCRPLKVEVFTLQDMLIMEYEGTQYTIQAQPR